MTALASALLGYGIWLMARQSGLDFSPERIQAELPGATDFTSNPRIMQARQALADWADEVPGPARPGQLRAVFSFLRFDDDDRTPVGIFSTPRRALSMHLTLPADQPVDQEPEQIWTAFWAQAQRLQPGWGLLETFTALMMRYGWALPGTLEDEGTSVSEQFKAVTALAHTLDPDHPDLLLVAGDLSGIQRMLYTVSAKGAAKALRGRSAYLQLLDDAIARALRRELQLPTACQVYNAGGNFQLLARPTDGTRLAEVRHAINQRLLHLHAGELVLALDWTPVLSDDLASPAFRNAVDHVQERLARQKARAFAELVAEDTASVFGLTGSGGVRFCEVCHVDLPDHRDPARLRCDQCQSFGDELAVQLADPDRSQFLIVHEQTHLGQIPDPAGWTGKPAWGQILQAFGYTYRFAGEHDHASAAHCFCYRVNNSDFLPTHPRADCGYGFRFLANITPRILPEEENTPERNQALRRCLPPDERDDPRAITRGVIRSTSLMAGWDCAGIHRYGVLRMDIDNLGSLFRERLDQPHMLRISALSAALNLFFEGWLNEICQQVASEWQARVQAVTKDDTADQRTKLPYVIYAGGDDLLIVGPWDVLPILAQRIRRDLGSYARQGFVAGNAPARESPITMSAGIFAETALFPLYQAADQAGAVLESAKRRKAYRRKWGTGEWVTVKDGVSMFGMTLGWAEFAQAEKLALELARLIAVEGAPHALLHLLADVALEYTQAGGNLTPDRLVYGRWMPLLAYGLKRMAGRVSPARSDLAHRILGLAGETLDLTRVDHAAQWHTIRFLSLPVRWAEFLIRKGG